MTIEEKIIEIRNHWIHKAREMGFEITTPFEVTHDNQLITFFAFLPQFGSKNGMIVSLFFPPVHSDIREVRVVAERNNLYCSLINFEVYVNADTAKLCEALQDWGYFGEAENRPKCFD